MSERICGVLAPGFRWERASAGSERVSIKKED